MCILNKDGILSSPWIQRIEEILNECGLSHIWIDQSFPNIRWVKLKVRQSLHDQYIQTWHTNLYNSEKCITYRLIKRELQFEKYLCELPPSLFIPLCKYRLSNHKLPIEKGRYLNIERHDRKCVYCNTLGDEYHYLFECTFFQKTAKDC